MKTYEADIATKQIHKGYWCIPEFSATENFWGELEYDPETAIIELTLFGFPLLKFCRNKLTDGISIYFDCIYGNLTSGKSVTILGAQYHQFSITNGDSLLSKISFRISDLMLGDVFFQKRKEIKFRSLSFRITNLELWTGVTPFLYSSLKRKKQNSIRCTNPKIIQLYEDEYVRIYISSESQSTLNHCDVNSTFHQKIKIACKRNRRLPFFGESGSFLYYISFVKSFFYLMIGRRVLLFDLKAVVRKQSHQVPFEKNKKILLPYSLQIFTPYLFEKIHLVKLNADELMTVKKKLTQPLSELFSNFIKDYQLYRDTLNIWHEVRSKSLVDEYTLSALLFCIEGLHRSLFSVFDEVPKEYAEKLADIQKALSKIQWEFIENKITYHCPFSKRISETIKNCKAFYPEFSSNLRKSIGSDICEKRNAAAHFRNEEGRYPIPKYLVLLLLEEFIAILIFQHIDLKSDDLKACFKGQKEYSFVVEKILQWKEAK